MAIHRGGSLLAMALTGLLCLAAVLFTMRRTSDEDLLEEARAARVRKQFPRVLELAEELLRRRPDGVEPLKLAGEASIATDQYDQAVAYLVSLPDSAQPERITKMLGPQDDLDSMRALSRLEVLLEERVALEPRHVMANDHLAYLLTVSGRRWEARAPLQRLLRRGRFTMRHLLMLGVFENHLSPAEMLKACNAAVPDDPLPKLGLALIAWEERDFAGARRLLETVAGRRPGLAEAQSRLGRLLLDDPLPAHFVDWHRGLQKSADEHPRVWLVRAEWARRHDQPRAVARCLWEALSREPDLRAANYELGQLLPSLDRNDEAGVFRERARLLEQFERTLGLIEIRLGLDHVWKDTSLLRRAAKQAEELGRLWEASGWASEVLHYDPQSAMARRMIDRIVVRVRAEPGLAQTVPTQNPALLVDLSALPLPRWPESSPERSGVPVGGQAPVPGTITFEDIAVSAGIRFTFFNSSDPSTAGARMFEYTGGGVAVIDFDEDGWPDLYFAQGCPWPAGDPDPDYRDRLFRNLGDGTFQDVTREAGLGDTGFSQGATVGDFDNDGWPDLYVANIGRNRFYRNNGDGTFTNISPAGDGAWTTSCLLADVNGDGYPDLYNVNYLSGQKLFSTICQVNGVKMACHPNEFPGQQDKLWLSDGQGGFHDATATSGIEVRDGKGLGIVAANLGGRGLSLFVANDATANFLFVPTARGSQQLFKEEALVRGLALDRQGRPQACMGVAAGDADGDGRLDLFVTNFYDEPNVFYHQNTEGTFSDTTGRVGLREPGWQMLGFGTQFLDGDLDGNPDLVVTNGHVDDLRQLDQPYRMRSQFFRNTGSGHYVELQPNTLGAYFKREVLGRGMARLDYDRDGRVDVAISHLESPVSLLANRTPEPGQFLAVRLVATSTSRDAIGTRVTVRRGAWRRSRQLTAGDGYLASNQRQLVFGLGSHVTLDELTVEWPSGHSTRWQDVSAGREVVVVEGRGRLIELPR